MNNKGFTLLEMMIVVAIVAILATTATVSLKGRAERNARIKARNMIPMFLDNAIDRAFDEGDGYTLDFEDIDKDDPIIKMEGRINKELSLPTVLEYSSDKNKVEIDSRGGFNKDFEIQVTDRDGNDLFKVEGTSISEIGLGKVEVVN